MASFTNIISFKAAHMGQALCSS